MKRIVTLAVLVALGLLIAAPALAGVKPYPPTKVTLGVSDSTPTPGETITVSGDNWCAGSTVQLALQPGNVDLGSATVNSNGHFSTSVTIPSDTQPGDYHIVASGKDGNCNPVTASVAITVVAAGAGVAFTGANLTVGMGVLAALLIAALLAFTVARRRRSGSV